MPRPTAPSQSRRRVIALVAAYAVALASLIAGFGAARAAAAAIADDPGTVICHTLAGGQTAPSPATDHSNDRTCLECCGTGCLMLMAALPSPPQHAVAAPQAIGRPLRPLATIAFVRSAEAKSHRSRAPPLTA